MYVSLLFWLALPLPGYVIVRHVSKEDLESGLLGTLGLCYVAVFAILSPLSICCYLLNLPVWVFTAGCLLIILVAPFELSRRKWWGDLFKLILAGFCVELVVILIDMFMGGRVGTTFAGDAQVHLARIRFLLDHGFSNLDPYCSTPYFWPIYHTNIFHAFYASASQLANGEYLAVWRASLPLGLLLNAAGAYYLVWTVFNRRWPAWVAAVFVVGLDGSVTFLVYPNKIAPYWLLPYTIGFAIQACRASFSWRTCSKLAAGALVIGQIHGLYALCAAGVIAPVLGIMFLIQIFRGKPNRWRFGIYIMAVCLGLPFPAVAKLKTSISGKKTQTTQLTKKKDGYFLYFENGWLMRHPKQGIVGRRLTAPFLIGVVCALLGSRRRDAAIALAIVGVAIVVFFTPPLCTAVLQVFKAEWILKRCGVVLKMGSIIFGVGAIAFVIESKTRFWWVRSLLSLVVLVVCITTLGKKVPHDWGTYRRTTRLSAQTRHKSLKRYQARRALFEELLPKRETILVSGRHGMNLVMLHNSYIVASISSSLGIPDLGQRRKDLGRMLSKETPWPERRELLRSYDVEYFYQTGKTPAWTDGHTKSIRKKGNTKVIHLDLD